MKCLTFGAITLTPDYPRGTAKVGELTDSLIEERFLFFETFDRVRATFTESIFEIEAIVASNFVRAFFEMDRPQVRTDAHTHKLLECFRFTRQE